MDTNNTEQNTISKKLLALNALLIIGVVFMVFVIYSDSDKEERKNTALVVETKPSAFDNINVGATAVYVYDVVGGKVLYKKNEFTQFPLASITKLMMALTASEILPEDSPITIKKEFLSEEGDSGLLTNESWKLKDLLDFSLVVSSNDGARSVASVVGAFDLKTNDYVLGRKEFINKMNNKAHELGLKQTYFINESGLDKGESSGGYGSAIDVAKLMEYILIHKPRLLEATKYQETNIKSNNKTHLAKNTNNNVEKIPALIASKTGFTDMAGGNLVVAFDASIGRPIIVVVLGSTQEGRFSDVSTLVKASLEYERE